jgi:alpha-beta hydrolase superfamily lysophospholipase
VHGEREDIQRMLNAFADAGLTRVSMKWYEGGRHEMFNETNRDDVVQDLVDWLNSTLAASA